MTIAKKSTIVVSFCLQNKEMCTLISIWLNEIASMKNQICMWKTLINWRWKFLVWRLKVLTPQNFYVFTNTSWHKYILTCYCCCGCLSSTKCKIWTYLNIYETLVFQSCALTRSWALWGSLMQRPQSMGISTGCHCGHDLYLADTCFLSWVLLFQLRWHSSGQQQLTASLVAKSKLKKSFETLLYCCTRKVYQKAGFHHIASYLTSVRNHRRQIILLKIFFVACTKRGLHYN